MGIKHSFLSEVGKLNFLRPHQSKSSSEFIFSRISDEEEQSGKEKLMIMRSELERYKDQWGLNIHYSHSAGAIQNYSEF